MYPDYFDQYFLLKRNSKIFSIPSEIVTIVAFTFIMNDFYTDIVNIYFDYEI